MQQNNGLVFEVCVDSIESALAAQAGGAQRVELCADLVEGGLTPSLGMLRTARTALEIRLNVLVRPRGGDFCYTEWEFAAMREDVLAAQSAGADGVVLGLLLPDGQVDRERTAALAALAQRGPRPLSVTFHRAIDVCRDAGEALEVLAALGIDRVLTSGRAASAPEGAAQIAALVRQSAGRVAIMPGGGVTAANVRALLEATGAREVHFSARAPFDSLMQYRREGVFMGKPYQPEEYTRRAATAEGVRAVIAAAGSCGSDY